MKKERFLKELRRGLKGIASAERADILLEYEAHFTNAIREGKSEEEISQSLGQPKLLAEELCATSAITEGTRSREAASVVRVVLAFISLGFFNLVFVLGPVLGLCGIFLACWCIVLALILSPIPLLMGAIVNWILSDFFRDLFISMVSLGVGLILFILVRYITIGFCALLLRYLKFNWRVIWGRSQ